MNTVQLAHLDIVEDHPFTHPDHTSADRRTLRYIANWLYQTLSRPNQYNHLPRPIILVQDDNEKRHLRQVITQPQRLLERSSLTIVGFFGDQRLSVDHSPLDKVDEALISELPEQEDLLGYCSLTDSKGTFSNLVLFANTDAKMQWRESKCHDHAVRDLAPLHYHSIRIYNGYLANGLAVPDALQLAKVNYLAYKHGSIWRAERSLNNFQTTE